MALVGYHDIMNIMQYCTNLAENILEISKLKLICGGLFTLFVFALGDNQETAMIVFVLVLLDAMMALIVVAKTDLRFKSSKLRHGAFKFIIYAFLIIAGTQFDKVINLPHAGLVPDSPVAKVVMIFLAATEMLSILEHCESLGLVIPHKLFSRIKKVRELEK